MAFILPFILYLFTLAPTVYNLDSAELTTAAATGGLVRATGYPLYLLLGRLWSLLPVGDVGYRLNLLSAFSGALTIALAERILRRLDVRGWAAFAALGLLATAPYFWAMSLIAEVYTLHTALMAAIVLLLLRWGERPTPTRFALLALTVGLSLGHHASTVLLLPGCAWYVLTVAPRRALAPRALLPAALAFLLGASIYLYLPWRYGYSPLPAFNYAGRYDASGSFVPVDLGTWSGLWWLVSGQAFAGEMIAYHGAALWPEVARFAVQLVQAFLGLGLGPALLGLVVLLRSDWRLGGALLSMFVIHAGFYINYRVVDKNTMFLPAYLVWALWLGVGYRRLQLWLDPGTAASRTAASRTKWGMALVQVVAVGAVLFAAGWNWRLVDLAGDWSARERGERILRSVEPNALILGWWDTVPLVEYLQLVEGQRPDVRAINRFLIDRDDMIVLVLSEAERRPVYIDSLPDDLPAPVRAVRSGPLYRLRVTRPVSGPCQGCVSGRSLQRSLSSQ